MWGNIVWGTVIWGTVIWGTIIWGNAVWGIDVVPFQMPLLDWDAFTHKEYPLHCLQC
jgi:hypothetical protein